MSIAQTLRGLIGQRLLQNTAGFKVIRASGSTSQWISDGESLALVPSGIQEVQFPVEVMGSDSITALAQVSAVFTYLEGAETFFNFAYDVTNSGHTGNFAEATKKAIISVIAPRVADALRSKDIAEMVKETNFSFAEKVSGIDVKSIMLVVKPRDAQVLAALGAAKSEELVRAANTARQETRMQAVAEAAELRTAEHDESIAAAAEAEALIAENAKNDLAKANSFAAAEAIRSKQQSESVAAMVISFNEDPMAFALHSLATSGGDVTLRYITPKSTFPNSKC